jgi:hypothetical protein
MIDSTILLWLGSSVRFEFVLIGDFIRDNGENATLVIVYGAKVENDGIKLIY